MALDAPPGGDQSSSPIFAFSNLPILYWTISRRFSVHVAPHTRYIDACVYRTGTHMLADFCFRSFCAFLIIRGRLSYVFRYRIAESAPCVRARVRACARALLAHDSHRMAHRAYARSFSLLRVISSRVFRSNSEQTVFAASTVRRPRGHSSEYRLNCHCQL